MAGFQAGLKLMVMRLSLAITGITAVQPSRLAHTEHFQVHAALLVFSPASTSQLAISHRGQLKFLQHDKQYFLKQRQNKLAGLKHPASKREATWEIYVVCCMIF